MVDFNRGGTPLVEIVTEPDVRSAADAREFLQLLRTTLKQIGVSDVNMEEGSLRCDANVSVRKTGEEGYRTKTELKNMNSFRFLERGIEAEIARQIATWESGGTVVQETIHFDPVTGSLTPLRSKEEVHDYRYFPEPDLVPVAPTEEMIERARAALPELPAARLERYRVRLRPRPRRRRHAGRTGASWAASSRRALRRRATATPPRSLRWTTGELVAACASRASRTRASRSCRRPRSRSWSGWSSDARCRVGAAKEVLGELTAQGGDPQAIVEARGLAPIADTRRAGGDRRARDRGERGRPSSRSGRGRRRPPARSWARS